MTPEPLNEPELPDDYPVYQGYAYVADGRVVISDMVGDVKRLKTYLKTDKVFRCDLVGRNLI